MRRKLKTLIILQLLAFLVALLPLSSTAHAASYMTVSTYSDFRMSIVGSGPSPLEFTLRITRSGDRPFPAMGASVQDAAGHHCAGGFAFGGGDYDEYVHPESNIDLTQCWRDFNFPPVKVVPQYPIYYNINFDGGGPDAELQYLIDDGVPTPTLVDVVTPGVLSSTVIAGAKKSGQAALVASTVASKLWENADSGSPLRSEPPGMTLCVYSTWTVTTRWATSSMRLGWYKISQATYDSARPFSLGDPGPEYLAETLPHSPVVERTAPGSQEALDGYYTEKVTFKRCDAPTGGVVLPQILAVGTPDRALKSVKFEARAELTQDGTVLANRSLGGAASDARGQLTHGQADALPLVLRWQEWQ